MIKTSLLNNRLLPVKALCIALIMIPFLSMMGCDATDLICIGKEEEIQIGDNLSEGILQTFGGQSHDMQIQTLITRVGKSIANKSDRSDLPWEFYYVNSEIPNAVALPGGRVFVTRGIIDLIRKGDGRVDVDMLAGILGHEIAHAVARHSARLIKENRLAELVEAGLDIITRRDVTADERAQFVRQFLILGYNRELEHEADKLGAIYAVRAGYAKDGLLRASNRLLQKEDIYSQSTPFWTKTHPDLRDRIGRLQQQIATLDNSTINQTAYEVNDQCKGLWGLVNLGVQYVRARYILKSGAEIELADSAGLGYPDTVIRKEKEKKTWYKVSGDEDRGLVHVATTVGKNEKPIYRDSIGYSPQKAEQLKQKAAKLLAQGQTRQAIKVLRKAIDLGAADVETRKMLADAYEKIGDRANADSTYRSVLRKEWREDAAANDTKPTDISSNMSERLDLESIQASQQLLEKAQRQLEEIRTRFRQAEQDAREASYELKQAKEKIARERISGNTTKRGGVGKQFKIPIPAGWIACQCPASHRGAGIIDEGGTQWHSPALQCP